MAKEEQEQNGSKDTDPRKAVARALWERLGKSRPGPTNADLVYIARFVPLLSTAAIKTLLNRPLTVDELKELIQHVPKAQEIACKRLLELPASDVIEEDLKFAFAETKSLSVAKMLLKRFPSNANLGLIERTTDKLSEAIEKIRAQETTSAIMKEIDRKL